MLFLIFLLCNEGKREKILYKNPWYSHATMNTLHMLLVSKGLRQGNLLIPMLKKHLIVLYNIS